MTLAYRSTLVVHGRLAMRESRIAAARNRRHGLQVMTFEQAAVRLAGGFARPIDAESLRAAIQAALPATPMGELESIKALPGMIDAAADTLHKAWRAGIDLASHAADHPRLAAIARLEAAILDRLPPGMMRPLDIVAAATARIAHAPAVLGPLEIAGPTELSGCWRPLLQALTDHIPVQWTAGPREVPAWLNGTGVEVARSPARKPEISSISAATAYHETIEAMRWARNLLASGVSASEIAIATASTADYDDYFLALRADANIDLHFVHGVRTVTTRDGQTAAALADIVVRGLSQSRLRRLAALCGDNGPFETLPTGWLRVLPTDAPLSTPGVWNRLLARLAPEDWPDRSEHAPALRAAVETLTKGPEAAGEIGEAFLNGRALAIWRKALLAGPAASIDATLETMKQDDGLEACVCVVWTPASALASSPRRFVRLLGLNSSRWPRGIAEDRLIPDHIIPTPVLDPLPVNLADRRDFETILATTVDEVVLSRARRDSDGRLFGRSPLLAAHGDETYLRRNATPARAFSETDRLLARPEEFASDPQAVSARICWRDWRQGEITPHDGLVRAGHPLVQAILDRTQSASSLRRLLRNPLSFIWVYAFGWREPQSSAEPLVLDALGIGDLVHMVLERALRKLEIGGGLVSASTKAIDVAVAEATEAVAADWESARPVPPAIIWRRTLDDARVMAGRALSYGDDPLPGARSYGEVPFGGSQPKSDTETPWDASTPVTIPDTGFNIAGYIDRLDVSGDGKRALVRDYKTGRPPRSEVRLNGGRELQRCLYAFAVKALLGDDVAISASLLYPREAVDLKLDDPEAVLAEITGYLRAARASFASGAALPGPDTGGDYDELAFALPANASATYCRRKMPAATERLGEVAQVWEAQ
ncbi:PD-(D/E)XK nuclease family protein [Defluviimonas sp. WL0024]|uniref:PD-(D/E)XK nuclease family protein n=1 Tax=Albidovulum salinarum TaxID=2984153 RepID=A0ABT2X5S4_9RHOB|nr:PD-(D/E)XK nuclease family protein [Defluviimonas sp. WL0024]MCU9849263.1 PD-(D/E)XK nuclease family protein [Defluviimonas sp. WL0024]